MMEPQTKAGKALLDRETDDISMFDWEWRETVLAIEAEAAQPYIEALRDLVKWANQSIRTHSMQDEVALMASVDEAFSLLQEDQVPAETP